MKNPVELSDRSLVEADKVIDVVGPLLTPERRQRIDQVLAERTDSVSVILENIYDRGNASAVMRSAEAFGLMNIHLIELGEKFKESQRTTAGAEKWLEIHRWKSTLECVKHLKKQGIKIYATHLGEGSVPMESIDFSKPAAIVLGNEKDGISKEMIAEADHLVILPMCGFVQSYNISVAAALSFYQIYQDRRKRLGKNGDLSAEQIKKFKAHYYLRTQASGEDVLKRS